MPQTTAGFASRNLWKTSHAVRIFLYALVFLCAMFGCAVFQPAQKAYADYDPSSGLTYRMMDNAVWVTDSSTLTPVIPQSINGYPVTDVHFDRHRGITSLDVSAATSLESLIIAENELLVLDVGNNTALTYLDCGGNHIVSLGSLRQWLYGPGHSGYVTPQRLEGAVIAPVADQVYTGAAIRPRPDVTMGGYPLYENQDFQYSYSNNVNVGTANLDLMGQAFFSGGMASFIGTVNSTFKIVPASIATADVSFGSSQSSLKTPDPVVGFNGEALKEGTDYEISYTDEDGYVLVTLKGLGNFEGTVSARYDTAAAPVPATAAAPVPVTASAPVTSVSSAGSASRGYLPATQDAVGSIPAVLAGLVVCSGMIIAASLRNRRVRKQ